MNRVPADFASREVAHQRRWDATQRWGNRMIGAVWGACLVLFFWLLNLWIDVGAP